MAEALLADPAVLPIGLGARDSLRLEAGLCLHGADIDPDTDPVEAGAGLGDPAGAPARRGAGGRLSRRRAHPRRPRGRPGAPARRPAPRGPRARAGRARRSSPTRPASEPSASVTSGGFGPSLQAPVAMGYLPAALAEPGTRVFAEVRGQRLPLAVAALPFVPAGFKRALIGPVPTHFPTPGESDAEIHRRARVAEAATATSPRSASRPTPPSSSATSSSSSCRRSAPS